MDEILIGIVPMVGMAIGFTAFAIWFVKGWEEYINRGGIPEEKWTRYQAYRQASERYVNEQLFSHTQLHHK